MSSPAGRYELCVTGPAQRQLGRLPNRVAAAIAEFMLGPLLDEPLRVGGRLPRELEGLHSARRGSYRIVYEVLEADALVVVHRIDHRATVYRPR